MSIEKDRAEFEEWLEAENYINLSETKRKRMLEAWQARAAKVGDADKLKAEAIREAIIEVLHNQPLLKPGEPSVIKTSDLLGYVDAMLNKEEG